MLCLISKKTVKLRCDSLPSARDWVKCLNIQADALATSLDAPEPSATAVASPRIHLDTEGKYGMLQFGDIKFFDNGLLGFVGKKDLQKSIEYEC